MSDLRNGIVVGKTKIIDDIVAGHTEHYIRRHYKMTANEYFAFVNLFQDRIHYEKIKKNCPEFHEL